MTDLEIVAHLEQRERQMRRDKRAAELRWVRYVKRTPIEQQLAEAAEENRRGVARGWITWYGAGQMDGCGI
jgi:phage protein D